MKFKKFTDFHDFDHKNLPRTLRLPLFPARGDIGRKELKFQEFLIFMKILKHTFEIKIKKRKYEKREFHKVLTHVGTENQFLIFLLKMLTIY